MTFDQILFVEECEKNAYDIHRNFIMQFAVPHNCNESCNESCKLETDSNRTLYIVDVTDVVSIQL